MYRFDWSLAPGIERAPHFPVSVTVADQLLFFTCVSILEYQE